MLNPPASPLKFPRLLLTGAGGNLGKELRPRLKSYCDVLRLSHRSDLGTSAPGEEIMLASLENKEQMMALMSGVDAVVHMGGVSTEQPWDPILASNIVSPGGLSSIVNLGITVRHLRTFLECIGINTSVSFSTLKNGVNFFAAVATTFTSAISLKELIRTLANAFRYDFAKEKRSKADRPKNK
jgi:hypothetical protein